MTLHFVSLKGKLKPYTQFGRSKIDFRSRVKGPLVYINFDLP